MVWARNSYTMTLSESQPIPKILHYCWFGRNPKSELIQKCMESWKVYCPDYEIIEWNEDNFDLNSNKFAKQAYDCKRWAFVSDYVRLWVLKNYGGVYVDTDLEILKPIDKFLAHRAFSGFQDTPRVPTAIMGAEKNHPWIEALLSYYDDLDFIKEDGTHMDDPNTYFMTEMTCEMYPLKINNSLQSLPDGLWMYPNDVFCPTWNIVCLTTENTHTIHHFTGTWWKNCPNHAKEVEVRESLNDSQLAHRLQNSKIGSIFLRGILYLRLLPTYLSNDTITPNKMRKGIVEILKGNNKYNR